MEKILLANAYEAWKKAYYYHHLILSGFFTLGNKKGLVASLHNAVELYIKQAMLDANDYSVAWVYNTKTKEKAQLQLDYLNSNDLNSFFMNLSSTELSDFRSIEFSQLIEKKYIFLSVNDVDDVDAIKYKKALNTLQMLRNNETHFYINEIGYLNEEEFISLWEFMKEFYRLMAKKGYLPFETISSSQGDFKEYDGRYSIATDYRCNVNFTYKSVLERNPIYKTIIERLSKIRCFTGDARMSDIDNLSWEVWKFEKGSKFSLAGFEEIENYCLILSIMKTYGMIRILVSNSKEYYDESSAEWEFSADYTVEIIN